MRRHSHEVMGTVVSFAVESGEDPTFAIRQACAWLDLVDDVFSPYRADSDVSRIAEGRLDPDKAHPLVAEVMDIGQRAERDGAGGFTLHPFGRFDPSGVVKGWAIERASALLAESGFPDHLVNGGGDIQARGTTADRPWRVAISDPRDSSRTVAVFGATESFAVATSGIAARGEHIHREHGTDLLSLTVIGEHLTSVDIAATTAFALGDAGFEWIEDRPNLAAFGIFADGRMWSSSRLAPYVLG